MKNIGIKLKSFARKNYRFFTDLTTTLNIHQPTLYKYFDGENLPNFDLLKKINYIGCNLNWLLDDDAPVENVPIAINMEEAKNYKPIENINVYMGQRLRNFCYRKYKNPSAVAKALEIRPSTLHNYINGRNLPGSKFLSKLLKLGCNIEWLLADNEETDYIPHEFELQKDLEENKKPIKISNSINARNELYSIANIKFGSVENLAKELGISRQALYPYIHGKPLTKKLLTKLKELGIKMEEEIEQQSTVDNNTDNDSELSKLREIIQSHEELIRSFRIIIGEQKFLIAEQREKIKMLEKRIEQKLVSHDFTRKGAKE